MIRIRSIVGLLASAVVATATYAQSTESAPKPAKAAKPAAPKPESIDLKRDANQAWSEMRKAPAEVKKGVSAAGRDAGKTFSEAGGKARDGFTGKAPPVIPDPPK